MPASAVAVFAGKSVASSVIKEIISKGLRYLDGYFSAESMEAMKSKLEQGMPKIQAVLDVVSVDHIKNKSKYLDAWFWQLRDAVEKAEDAIDELEYYELKEKAQNDRVSDWGSPFAKMKHKVVRSIKHVGALDKTVKQFTHRGTIKRLKKAMEDLDKAAEDITSILAVTGYLKGAVSINQLPEELTSNDRETGSILSTTKFFGRELEKSRIIEWLTKNVTVDEAGIMLSANYVPIFSLVGHGGMGKTALAQSICQHDKVVKDFKIIWVTVSNIFDAKSVTRKILESATGNEPSDKHLEALQQDLKEKLASAKFLLVLDDVWEDGKRNEWEKLFAPLRSGKSGSRILLTTRMISVADMAANVMGVGRDYLLLAELDENENIELFHHHAFSGVNSQDYMHFKLTGEKIARKLGGCPLVTKVASGHLQGNMTFEYWESFLHKGLEHFKGSEDDIMNILKLSYYYLPTELQVCFRYCSLFPEDYKFEKKKIVQMWMGSGLISQAANDTLTLEDIGERFLVQLTRKSFFDVKGTEYYVMHDLMHELARSVSSGECTRITNPSRIKDVHDTIRHLCISCIQECSMEEIKKISKFKNLRSIIIDFDSVIDKDTMCALQKIVESSKLLRLFDSRLSRTFEFSSKFGRLKHLRYINMYEISSKGICSIINLYHLMVLSGNKCWQGETKQIRCVGNLYRLQHVKYGMDGLGEFPISRLESIQELSNYSLQGNGGNKMSSIGNLQCLRELDVGCIENIENHEEAINAKLNEKCHLSSLSLSWSTSTGAENRADEQVLHHLEPHPNIRKLRIQGYGGHSVPFWIENLSVRNLVSLSLCDCSNWEQLPSLVELVFLKHLFLQDLPKLQQIGQQSLMPSTNGMKQLLPPTLQTLFIRTCPELQELTLVPPSLVSFEIIEVNWTKLPKIDKLCSEGDGTRLSKLQEVIITRCPCLTSLEGSFFVQKRYMGAIGTLEIIDCLQLGFASESCGFPFQISMGDCPKLSTLSIESCGDLGVALLGSLHVQQLTNLSQLVLKNCSSLVSLPSAEVFSRKFASLEYITIEACENLSSLGGLGSLPSPLSVLEIRRCAKLMEVSSSQTPHSSGGEEERPVDSDSKSSLHIFHLEIDLPSLLLVEPIRSLCHTEKLLIEDASEMDSLPDRWLLQNRTSLRTLRIQRAESLESLSPSLQDISSLQVLDLSGARQLRSLPDLPPSLLELLLYGTGQLKSLSDLPSSLETLKLGGASQLKSLPDLPSSLERLYLGGAGQLKSLPDLPSSLETLHLHGASQLKSLPDLPSSLETLHLRGASQLKSLPDLPSSLEMLHLFGASQLKSLPDLPSSLDMLDLFVGASQLKSLLDLPSSLEMLHLDGASQLKSLPDLPSSLKTLHLDGASQLKSLPDLPSSLKMLHLDGASQLKSLPDLPSSMEALFIWGNSEMKMRIAKRKRRSPERSKISHILRVDIGDSLFVMGKKCY